MINFQLQLLPSEWTCDVWIGDGSEIAKQVTEIYECPNPAYFYENLQHPRVISPVFHIKDDCYKILCYLQDFDKKVVAHECLHVTWHFADRIGTSWSVLNQEFQALYLEWLFDEIMKRKA